MRCEEKALDIAKYVVTAAYRQGTPVSNLKLQGILYFLWNEYYRETGKCLFRENFCAWRIGPVVPEVYYFYCPWAGTPIFPLPTNEPEISSRPVFGWVSEKLDKCPSYPPQYFLRYGQNEIPAWHTVWNNGNGSRKEISWNLLTA